MFQDTAILVFLLVIALLFVAYGIKIVMILDDIFHAFLAALIMKEEKKTLDDKTNKGDLVK